MAPFEQEKPGGAEYVGAGCLFKQSSLFHLANLNFEGLGGLNLRAARRAHIYRESL